MSICLLSAGKLTVIAATSFTLAWTHSVEKTEWQESWSVYQNKLKLTEARVKGSGAGMDPGEGAKLQDGWWVWTPQLLPVEELNLSASGETPGGWRLCHGNGGAQCVEFGATRQEAARIHYCDGNG